MEAAEPEGKYAKSKQMGTELEFAVTEPAKESNNIMHIFTFMQIYWSPSIYPFQYTWKTLGLSVYF